MFLYCGSAKFTTGDFECMVCLKKFTLKNIYCALLSGEQLYIIKFCNPWVSCFCKTWAEFMVITWRVELPQGLELAQFGTRKHHNALHSSGYLFSCRESLPNEIICHFTSRHYSTPMFLLAFSHGRLSRWCKWRACDVGEAKEGWTMSCDAGEAKEGLENELWPRWSNGSVWEWVVTKIKRRKGWRMSCDVGEVTERFENEPSS